MKRVTAKLVLEAQERLADITTVPAQNVFMALLGMSARREAWPGMEAMAKRGHMGDERLGTALDLLESYGLLSLPTNPADRRQRLPVLDVDLIRAWVAGAHELCCLPRSGHVNSPENAGQSTPENAGYFKAETPGNAGFPRARGNSSSSSYARSTSAPADAHEANELHVAMVSAVRKALTSLPPGIRDDIWTWVGVYPVGLVQDACVVTRRKGGRSFDYIDTVLRGMQAAVALPDTSGDES